MVAAAAAAGGRSINCKTSCRTERSSSIQLEMSSPYRAWTSPWLRRGGFHILTAAGGGIWEGPRGIWAEYYYLSLPCRRFYSLYYDPPSPKWKPAFRGRYFFLTSDASMAISEGCSSESLSDSSIPSVPSSLNQCPHHLTEQLLPPFCLTAALTKNWLEQLKYDQ